MVNLQIKLIEPERRKHGPTFRVWLDKDNELFERGYDQIVEGMCELTMRVNDLKAMLEERSILYNVHMDWCTETSW